MSTQRALQAWNMVKVSHSRGTALPWGPTNIDRFIADPKRIGFMHARYSFAAKMMRRCHNILDVGCGDGSGTLNFLTDTGANNVLGLDFDAEMIEFAVEHTQRARAEIVGDADRLEFVTCDFLKSPYVNFDGLCCLDVIEHVDPVSAPAFIARLAGSLSERGIAVIGTPSLASAPYASVHSQAGHINLYDPARLCAEFEVHFRRVTIHPMNDFIVHTGHPNFGHYLIAVCVK